MACVIWQIPEEKYACSSASLGFMSNTCHARVPNRESTPESARPVTFTAGLTIFLRRPNRSPESEQSDHPQVGPTNSRKFFPS